MVQTSPSGEKSRWTVAPGIAPSIRALPQSIGSQSLNRRPARFAPGHRQDALAVFRTDRPYQFDSTGRDKTQCKKRALPYGGNRSVPQMRHHFGREQFHIATRQIVRHDAELQHGDQEINAGLLTHPLNLLAHGRGTAHDRGSVGY